MQQLNLLVIRCADVDAAKRFYELIGMKFESHQHGHGPQHYAHEDERGVFELYPLAAGAGKDQTGLGFRAADLVEMHRQMANAGFSPGEIKIQPWGRTFVVRDPDGRRVELKDG